MDENIKGNPGALNYGAVPRRPKLKPFGNYANSNKFTTQTKKQVKKGRKGGKKRPLQYKQNLG